MSFGIYHALYCKKGVLIAARHNKLRDGVVDLMSKVLIPMHVREDTKIYTVRTVHGGKERFKGSISKDKGELKGDLLIRYLWTQRVESIHDMRVVNIEAISYQSKNPEKCLETAEK